jgi:type I restriction enzyme, R subunit
MSENAFVEKPFLEQLAALGWRVVDQGAGRAFIIPDIVLFVNGLPLVVIECKDANAYTANPMYEAFRQLQRYCDQRTETRLSGLREDEPGRFDTNQLLIRTCGEQAEFGTITSTDEEFFFGWNDIYPETYRNYTPPLGTERAQERLIQGMSPPATLLDIVRNGTLFMELEKKRVKIVCRYQQYREVCKIIDRLRTSKTPAERSGVIWHTQGSGKSLTMVFVIRKLRMCDEKVTTIASTGELKTQLATATANLNMVMVHKFWEQHNRGISDYLESVLERVPTFERFGLVNSSERILLMIDEAHRTQSGDLGDNLFEAFPNATRLAFTGKPLVDETASRVSVPRQPRSTTSLASSPSAATVCPIPMSRRSSGSRQRSWRCCSAPLPSSTSGTTVPKSVNSKGFHLISSCSPESTR